LILIIFAFCSISARAANAATLYFSPSSGSYKIGQNFSVSIYVSSSDQAMNAVSGTVSFSKDKLSVVSLSKSGSIISLWVQEPSFSNSSGSANFEGIVLNPGFTGKIGKIITINFKVKSLGLAAVNFSSGAVLANDGKGTNILSGLDNANFELGEQAGESTTLSGAVGVPLAPKIFSPTHPDPEKWYSDSNPKFVWPVPSGITSIRLLHDKLSVSNPQIVYGSSVSEKELTDIKDGIWYFHNQFKNNNGWGAVSHFRFQIDTGKPDYFNIKEIERDDLTEPVAKFIFDSSDAVSGIDHYEIQIDSVNVILWQDDGSHVYETPVSEPGKHILIAKAVDRAGNFFADSIEFQINPLNPPKITDYPKSLQDNEILIIKGETEYDGAQIILWLQREKDETKTQTVKSDENGKFIFISEERLKEGIYKAWAEVVDERGARSGPSENISFIVQQSSLFRIGSWAVSFLAIIIPLIALIILLILLLLYAWRKLSRFRKKVEKEVHEAEHLLHKAFDLLREDIKEQIRIFDKVKTNRQLTKEEQAVIKKLKKDLDDTEKFIKKEIKDVESL
jgi:hypothetical protein